MSDTNKQLSDAEIAAKTGFGQTAEEAEAAQEESTESEEDTENKENAEEEAEESEESEEEEADQAARKSREEAEEEEEQEEESEESEEESEEDESEEEDKSNKSSKSKAKRTVPYSLLKSSKAKIRELQAELDAARKSNEEGDGSEEEVEEAATKLGEELGMDKEDIKKILKTSLKLNSKKSALPKDVEEKLKALDEIQKERMQEKEVAHFRKEWEQLDIKKQYPNAPKAALQEAQEFMDKLAHSKDFHKYDLDYILYKNKAKFDTILKTAPKGKSGEGAKRVGTEKNYESSGDDEENLIDITDMNPSIMKEREAKELEMRKAHAKDKDYRVFNPRQDD